MTACNAASPVFQTTPAFFIYSMKGEEMEQEN